VEGLHVILCVVHLLGGRLQGLLAQLLLEGVLLGIDSSPLKLFIF
jgi:hypothetical protein